jgi:hypothetical protein
LPIEFEDVANEENEQKINANQSVSVKVIVIAAHALEVNHHRTKKGR